MNYSRFFTEVAKRQQPSILRDVFKLTIGVGDNWAFNVGGMPNESLFPLTTGEFSMPDGTKITINEKMMKEALQYGLSAGYPPLLEEIQKLVKKYHDPPRPSERGFIVTDGAQDALAKVINMLVSEGDYILIEEPAYSSILSQMTPLAPKFLPLETDEMGLKPDSLRAALSRWRPEEMAKAEKGVPKFLYTNPAGNNPSGTILPENRRREIYDICCKYNLLIVEDDPYYFYQYIPQEEIPPSFLTLDTECRVIRMDTFSKTIAAGLRVGFVVAPEPIARKMEIVQQITALHTSNMSQIIITELLRTWGEEGFSKHVMICKEFYQKRRDQVLLLAEKHLSDLCEWKVPAGGLFLWIKMKNVPDVYHMIMDKATTKKLLLVPGNTFMTDADKPSSYARVAFSHGPLEEIDEVFRRFAEMIREEIKLHDSIKE